jgi:hypothetical protein
MSEFFLFVTLCPITARQNSELMFKVIILFLSTCLLTMGHINLMSLYHYSETTFLNLKLQSRPVQLTFMFNPNHRMDSNLNIAAKSVSDALNAKIVETAESNYKIQHKEDGFISLSSTTTETSFLKSPNGIRSQQGWILTEKDYPTDEYLEGDMKTFKQLKNVMGKYENYFINIQVPEEASFLKNLLINRFRKENAELVDTSEKNLQKNKQDFSEGFLKKLFSTDKLGNYTYNPTMDELYEDYIIRQGLEINSKSIKRNFWNESIDDLRKEFLELDYQHPTYKIDILPVLLKHRPTDEVTLKLKLKSGNFIQFHEFEGDFIEGIKRAAGLVKATEVLGYFIADNAISEFHSLKFISFNKFVIISLEDQINVFTSNILSQVLNIVQNITVQKVNC